MQYCNPWLAYGDVVETKPIYGYSLTAELLGDCGGNFYRMSNVSEIAIPASSPALKDIGANGNVLILIKLMHNLRIDVSKLHEFV